MKRLFGAFVLLSSIVAFCASPVYADDACSIAGYDDPLICGTSNSDEETVLQGRIKNVLDTVYLWVGIIAVVVIVIGGIQYMTSMGEAEKIKRAKSTITYSVVGLVLVLAAFAITNTVLNALEGRAPSETVADEPGGGGGGAEDRKIVKAVTMISSTKMQIDETAKLKAKIVPDYAEDKTLTWSSDDSKVVTVDKNGNIKAIKAGTATITVKSSNDKSAKCKVTVLEEIKVSSIKVSPASLKLEKGKKGTITATVSPINAKNKTLKWTSSNEKIATVSDKGVVVAKAVGKATITVSSVNDKKATVGVVVVEQGAGQDAETTGSQTNTPLNGKPNMRKATQNIIDDHRTDFYINTYDNYIKKRGGYNKYLKEDLGGVFAKYADVEKIQVKTAADFQEAAEYVYGLMMIWGGDYNGNHNVAWRNNKVWKNGKRDRFRSSFGGKKYGYRDIAIDRRLKTKKETNYVCSTMLGTFISSTTLKYHYIEANGNKSYNQLKKYPAVTKPSKLQVGDVLFWHNQHVAIVGEVYKDYVIVYDGGSRFTSAGSYKVKMNRKTGAGYNKGWIGFRLWNIDQKVTLKGIN